MRRRLQSWRHRGADPTGRSRGFDRVELIAAARTAFDDLGPGASMGDIAHSTGIPTSVWFEQFPDRDAVIDAVLDELIASLCADAGADDTAAVRQWAPNFPRLHPKYAVAPLAAVAALLPQGASPTAVAATTETAPTTVLTLSPLWPVSSLKNALQGSLCEPDACVALRYLPFWTGGGVDLLTAHLSPADTLARSTFDTGTVVFGYSHGAIVAAEWIAEHADDPDAPSPDQLSFVFIGNPTRAYGGRLPAMPQSQYQVIDIVRQYDPVGDFPDNPFNLLALLNVAAGILSPIHLDYRGVDIDDPANIVWTEGNITYVFVPTENLPLLSPLRLIGLHGLADLLNGPIKEIVEQAYHRPYLPPAEPADIPSAPVTEEAAASVAAVDAGDEPQTGFTATARSSVEPPDDDAEQPAEPPEPAEVVDEAPEDTEGTEPDIEETTAEPADAEDAPDETSEDRQPAAGEDGGEGGGEDGGD